MGESWSHLSKLIALYLKDLCILLYVNFTSIKRKKESSQMENTEDQFYIARAPKHNVSSTI